jgi:Holliday junction DNA helicase RuvA
VAPAAQPEVPPDAVAEVKKAGRGRKPPEAESAPAAKPVAFDGQAIDDVYQALMGLGLNPVEARGKLDSLLQSGKPFKTAQDGLALIFATRS